MADRTPTTGRIFRTAASRLGASQGADHNGPGTTCTGANSQGFFRTIHGAGPALHAGIASDDPGFPIFDDKHRRGILADNGPVIISPEDGAIFELRDGIPIDYQQILLKAAAAPDVRTLHWFMDRKLFASSRVEAPLFCAPRPGRHTLMCVDDLGRSNMISFEIK